MNNSTVKVLAIACGCITIFGNLISFSSDEKAQALVDIEHDAYNAPSEVILEAYYWEFIEEAKAHGIDLSNTIDKEKRFSFTDETYGQVLGISWEKDNDDKIVINVLTKAWLRSNEVKRKYLMFHELGHDVLNLSHGSTPIMKALLPNTPDEELLELHINEMFKHYKNE